MARKLQLWTFKRAVRLRSLAKYNVALDIRLTDPNAGQEGFDNHRDIVIYAAMDKITNPEWFDESLSKDWATRPFHDDPNSLAELISRYVSNRDEVDQLVEKALSNPQVRRWLTNYLRVNCYIQAALGNIADKRETEYWTQRLAEVDTNANPVVAGDIEKMISEAKRDIKASRFALSDREALKIPLGFEWVGPMISVMSALLLISGFIYTHAFFGFFGVPTAQYFSVSDYISSSAEQLYSVCLSVFIGLIAVFLGAHSTSRKPAVVLQEQQKRPDIFSWFVGGMIPLITVAGLLNGGRVLHEGISTIILLSGFLIVPFLAARFFKDRLRAIFVLIVLFAFASNIYRTVYSNIYNVLENESVARLCGQVTIIAPDEIAVMLPCGAAVIGATESHVFVFYQEKAKTVVLPRTQVVQGVFDTPLFEENLANLASRWLTGWLFGEESRGETQGGVFSDKHEKPTAAEGQN